MNLVQHWWHCLCSHMTKRNAMQNACSGRLNQAKLVLFKTLVPDEICSFHKPFMSQCFWRRSLSPIYLQHDTRSALRKKQSMLGSCAWEDLTPIREGRMGAVAGPGSTKGTVLWRANFCFTYVRFSCSYVLGFGRGCRLRGHQSQP